MASDQTSTAAHEPTQDRSPSPVAPPPVSAAPGPRARTLQKLFGEAITHVLKTCSYNNFATCFPTPAQHVPQSLKHLHEQFTERLGASMRINFEQILAERNVVPSLNALDDMVEDAKKRKITAEEQADGQAVQPPILPHTLPARQLYLSHLAPSLAQQSQILSERRQMLQTENVELLNNVMQQRKDINALVERLEAAVAHIDATAAALKPEELDSLRDEARELDGDI